jgi:protein-L-isoaspartate(D-aspartate) O-methyltransferase
MAADPWRVAIEVVDFMSDWEKIGSDADEADVRFKELRGLMVRTQLEARGISDQRVLDAMLAVPREAFVPQDLRPYAYDDTPLQIGYGQTISQPFTVAFMAEALQLIGSEKVLEVGTGSGYGAAVLSRLARVVFTVERISALGDRARARLEQLGYGNVHVCIANGTLGLPDQAPFDAIVVTAGAEELPPDYWRQLADGGRIVIPLGHTPMSQRMCRFTRRADDVEVEDLGSFAFVPLIGQHGWSEQDAVE